MDKFFHHSVKFNKRIKRGALISALLMLSACSQTAADYTITLGGDIMLARAGEPIFADANGHIDPWVDLYSSGILSSDSNAYFFANLESPLGMTTLPSGEMNLCSDPAEVRLLQEGELDLLTLANNHRDDCQAGGSQQTGAYLSKKDILSTSAGDGAVYIDTQKGTLAVIAADDVTRAVDMDDLVQSIIIARQNAQVVIVSMHWGSEYQAGPDQRQQALAQQLADAGADVIWGHHPHVLQKMELLESTDGRQVLVLYSLGNLLSDQWMLQDALRTALVKLDLQNGKITSIEILPLMMDRADKELRPADQIESAPILERLQVDDIDDQNVEVLIK